MTVNKKKRIIIISMISKRNSNFTGSVNENNINNNEKIINKEKKAKCKNLLASIAPRNFVFGFLNLFLSRYILSGSPPSVLPGVMLFIKTPAKKTLNIYQKLLLIRLDRANLNLRKRNRKLKSIEINERAMKGGFALKKELYAFIKLISLNK